MTNRTEVLEMALVGLGTIQAQIQEEMRALSGKPKRRMSAAARKRISAAQKKRWRAQEATNVN